MFEALAPGQQLRCAAQRSSAGPAMPFRQGRLDELREVLDWPRRSAARRLARVGAGQHLRQLLQAL